MAAVHLKPELADRIGENYLNAPREALPPPQGTDAVLVLTQALVARRRRVIRDVLVLVLIVVSGVAVLPYTLFFLFIWGILWLFWSLTFGRNRPPAATTPRTDEEETSTAGLISTLVFLGGWFVFGTITSMIVALFHPFSNDPDSSGMWASLLTALLFILPWVPILVVLLLDKWVTRYLISSGGGRKPVSANPVVAGLANALTSSVTYSHVELLNAVAQRPDGNTALAHTGWHAFPGYGHRLNAWTFPLVLRPRKQGADPPALRPKELYSAVTEELLSMSDSDRLAPNKRLRELTVRPVVVINAAQLHRNSAAPTARALLSRGSGPPLSSVAPETMDALLEEDTEWARHFQESSVLSWDSELLVTTLFNISCDNRTLYLEWNAYCLFPMAPEHRLNGSVENTFNDVASATLLEFLQTLGSIAWRWRTLDGALPRRRINRPRDNNVHSIREIVADQECVNEFQDLDGQRHVTLLQERTLSAVRNHLAERGFSTEALEEQATQIINNTTNNFHGSQFLGAQNFGANSTATAVAASSTATHVPGRDNG
ncbi:hypothetical protein [Actinopolyspora halophila]|uniref:hypothetical protein n=1 Tax=Actinopolyspora halophila TaxID=1850 RepID=UPI0003671D36|nr:hypothetical protein [Actinopolyspora halophila]